MPVTVIPNRDCSRRTRHTRPSRAGRTANVAATMTTRTLDSTVKKLKNLMSRVDTAGSAPLGSTSTLTPWITSTSCHTSPTSTATAVTACHADPSLGPTGRTVTPQMLAPLLQ